MCFLREGASSSIMHAAELLVEMAIHVPTEPQVWSLLSDSYIAFNTALAQQVNADELFADNPLRDYIVEKSMGERYKRLKRRLQSFRSSPANVIEIGDRPFLLPVNISGKDSYQFPLRSAVSSESFISDMSHTCSGSWCTGFNICSVRAVLLEPCLCSLYSYTEEQVWCVCNVGERCIRSARPKKKCTCIPI